MKLSPKDFTSNIHNWYSWRWQVEHSITCVKQLPAQIKVDEADLKKCVSQFPMRITPYYLSLIEWDNPNDPIRKQAIPSKEELETEDWEMDDPLSEEASSPVRTIVHRYPDRVLFTVSSTCAMYCRHCTRKRWAGHLPIPFSSSDLEQGIEYITNHSKIRDVIVSGGDPLMLSDNLIVYLIRQLSSIEHVEMIRIGTRVPVTLPMRVTDELAYRLGQFPKLWVNTHFNHVNEITSFSTAACRKFQSVGIPVNNQSVLLRGVNDTLEDMRNLVHGLMKIRVRPYYLYQCDLARGLKHFRTNIDTGVNIIRGLRGFTSGMCIPQFVIDSPKGGGKVPINPDYITDVTEDYLEFVNFQGKHYRYPRNLEFVNFQGKHYKYPRS